MFLLVNGDDWPSIAIPYIRASKEEGKVAEIIAYLYFIALLLTGTIVLMALLTALLLKNYNSKQARDESEIDRMLREQYKEEE